MKKIQEITIMVDLAKLYEKIQNYTQEKALIFFPDDFSSDSKLKAMLKGKHVVLSPINHQKKEQLKHPLTSSKCFELNTTNDISEVIAQKEQENQDLALQI